MTRQREDEIDLLKPLDLCKIKTYSIKERKNLSNINLFAKPVLPADGMYAVMPVCREADQAEDRSMRRPEVFSGRNGVMGRNNCHAQNVRQQFLFRNDLRTAISSPS